KGQRPGHGVTRMRSISIEGLQTSLSRKRAKPDLRLRDASPRQREPRVQLHRALVSSQSFARTFFGVAILIKTTLQIILVSLYVFCPAFFRRLYFRLNFLFVG